MVRELILLNLYLNLYIVILINACTYLKAVQYSALWAPEITIVTKRTSKSYKQSQTLKFIPKTFTVLEEKNYKSVPTTT